MTEKRRCIHGRTEKQVCAKCNAMDNAPDPAPLDAAWEALWLALGNEDAGPAAIIARHRPLIEAEARTFAPDPAPLDDPPLHFEGCILPPNHHTDCAYAAPDPAPLDVERLARAIWSVTRERFAASPLVPDLPEWRDPSIDAATWDKSVSDAAEVAREYAKDPQP